MGPQNTSCENKLRDEPARAMSHVQNLFYIHLPFHFLSGWPRTSVEGYPYHKPASAWTPCLRILQRLCVKNMKSAEVKLFSVQLKDYMIACGKGKFSGVRPMEHSFDSLVLKRNL